MALLPASLTDIYQAPSDSFGATFMDTIAFPGDAAYAAGGSEDFTEFFRAAFPGRTPIAIIANDCGIFRPVFLIATDKLKVFRNDTGAEASGDLSGTIFNVTVISK